MKLRVVLSLVTCGVLSGAIALTVHETSAPQASGARRVVRNSGYELDDSLSAMTSFTGNSDIVSGHVVGADPARWNTVDGAAPSDDAAAGGLYFVFTPVHVAVDEVLRGDRTLANTEIVVRRWDGTVGDTAFVTEDGQPSTVLLGAQSVVLFLQPQHELNDGRHDRIPNAAYVLDAQSGELANADGVVRGTIDTVRQLVAAG
jgi:hypothetical protein